MSIETATSAPTVYGETATTERPLVRSMLRGLLCRCPKCGKGKLFSGYLTSVHACARCDEVLDVHRADDLPPYLTVFVVGHVIVAMFMALEELADLSMGVHLAIFVPLTILMSLAMLRPFKGATIGLQWSMRMHGFGDGPAEADH